jgi:hypothetical protein
MYSKRNVLSDAEQVRLEEIEFCNFIDYLFRLNSNPTKVYAFIEVVCTLSNCNLPIINGAVSICMTQDRRYKTTKEEFIHLLSKAAMPVRKLIPYVGVSQRDYYKVLRQKPPDIQPKFQPKQYIEMIKFLQGLRNLVPERMW